MGEHMEVDSEFVATPNQRRMITEVLDRPARVMPELVRLFFERKKKEFTTESTEGTE